MKIKVKRTKISKRYLKAYLLQTTNLSEKKINLLVIQAKNPQMTPNGTVLVFMPLYESRIKSTK